MQIALSFFKHEGSARTAPKWSKAPTQLCIFRKLSFVLKGRKCMKCVEWLIYRRPKSANDFADPRTVWLVGVEASDLLILCWETVGSDERLLKLTRSTQQFSCRIFSNWKRSQVLTARMTRNGRKNSGSRHQMNLPTLSGRVFVFFRISLQWWSSQFSNSIIFMLQYLPGMMNFNM